MCIHFQVGNSFKNTKLERENHLCIRFKYAMQLGIIKWKKNHVFVFNVAIHFGLLEWKEQFTCVSVFKNGNTKIERTVHMWIRFQLGHSCGNIKTERTVHLCIHFQVGNSLGNAKMEEKRFTCAYAFVFN